MIHNVTVPGQPWPKPRPRVTRWGTYNSAGYETYKEDVRSAFRRQVGAGDYMTSGPWSLSLEFHIRSAGVGDVDNLAGAILDALEGLLWANDRDVVDLNVRKVYDLKKGHQPWTSIECVPDDHA